MKVFITLIKVKPEAGCQLDPEQVDQALVQCFVPAKGEKAAAEYLFEVLEELKLEFIEEEYLVADYDLDWENPDNQELKQLVEQARESQEIIFSDFYPA